MIVLFDTNVLIQREDNNILSDRLTNLLNMMGKLRYQPHVHDVSYLDISNDKDIQRREVNKSKLNAYPRIGKNPLCQNDDVFHNIVGKPSKSNDEIDNHMLYAVYKNAADYLITEDIAMLNKAEKLGIDNKVLSINQAIIIFKSALPNFEINILNFFKEEKGSNLDLNDSIFDSLKEEYGDKEFGEWWNNKVSKRSVYVYVDDTEDKNKIKAILVPKIEEKDETIDCTPALNLGRRLKICLFKVADHAQGLRLGERLLSMAFDFAQRNNLEDIYLTHFLKPNDSLVKLIEEYGFYQHGVKKNNEGIFAKKIIPNKNFAIKKEDIYNLNRTFFPGFYDGDFISKYIVPIRPLYHERLFPDYKYYIEHEQLSLFPQNQQTPEGNSIKKAYICNAPTRQIKEGDILLFYRTVDFKCITTLGIVEKVYYNLTDVKEVQDIVAKRTVYSQEEIKEKMQPKSSIVVILFKQNFHLKEVFYYSDLLENNIVAGAIQTITKIDDNRYKQIIKGKLDERFIINKA